MKRTPAALRLDFHTNPARNRSRNGIAMILSLVLLVTALVYYRHLEQANAILRQDMQQLSQEQSRPAPTAVRHGGEDEASKKLLQQLNAPWEVLLDGIEASATDKATLLLMQPNIRQGEVVLGGEAARYSDVLAYVERLKAQKGFGQAYLTSHEIAEEVAGKPVRFNILLKWGGPE